MKKENIIIGYIGIGIFTFLTIESIQSILKIIIEKSLMLLTMPTIVHYALSKYLSLAIILIIFLKFIKKVKTINLDNKRSLLRIFVFSIAAFAVSLILSSLLPYIIGVFESDNYINSMANYYSDRNHHPLLNFFVVDIPVVLLEYSFVAIIVIKQIKSGIEK